MSETQNQLRPFFFFQVDFDGSTRFSEPEGRLRICIFHKHLWDCDAGDPLPSSENHLSGAVILSQRREPQLRGRKLAGQLTGDARVPFGTQPLPPAPLAPSSASSNAFFAHIEGSEVVE